MADKITWTNNIRKLSELVPWPINPAQIGKDEAKRLEESLAEFGQIQTIAISPTNEIYDGHQRQTVWGASRKFGMDYQVDVRVSSRELTEQERKKLVIYLRKGTVGAFDFDLLANNWNFDELIDWGFTEYELGIGDTSTDRKGQGVNSSWDQVNSSDNTKVIIGDIETRLNEQTAKRLIDLLNKEYSENRTPIFETLETIIITGMDKFEDSNN